MITLTTTDSILITGVGAVIGQGIIKSLRMDDQGYRLVGVDSNPFAVGLDWADKGYVVPKTSEDNWAEMIIEICRNERVKMVLCGIEQDVEAFIKNKKEFRASLDLPVPLNSELALRLGFDKWECYRFAVDNGYKVPETWLFDEFQESRSSEYGLPILLKPRKGMAGKGIYKISDPDQIAIWRKLLPTGNYIVQQCIGTPEDEFTASIFCFSNGNRSRPIMFRRRLSYGSTFEAETVLDEKLAETVESIARKLDARGPTNMQFRKEGGDYYLLEIKIMHY